MDFEKGRTWVCQHEWRDGSNAAKAGPDAGKAKTNARKGNNGGPTVEIHAR